MKIILTIFLLMFSTFAYGQNMSVTLSGVSIHTKKGFNALNAGIGLEKVVYGDFSIAGGVFNNSIDNTSAYLAVKHKVVEISDISVSLMAGGVTGYQPNATPFLLPEICYKYVCVVIVPPVNDRVVGAAAFYVKIPVN